MESGVPYITNKDQVNRMSNQRNVGPVISSNLCNEIGQHSSPEETAVCNLANFCLVRFFDETTRDVNYRKLAEFAGYAIEALINVIDRSIYPTPCAERSNMRHRPLG
ncbi:Ribonucleoside-diphosphate reductase large subunit, partial [Hondaea fermentalgiana]